MRGIGGEASNDPARHAPRNLNFPFSEFPSDGLAEALRDQLCLVDVESVYADLECGASFLDDEAQAGSRRVAEVYIVPLVTHAADRFCGDARQCRRLAGVEAINGALATERLHNGQRCKPALSCPLTRRWTADRFPRIDRNLQRRADLRLSDQRAGFVRGKRLDWIEHQNDTNERNSAYNRAHLERKLGFLPIG
jgi:hypothetical protein